jgi:DNA-binding transcriptional LysR family regulator
MDKANRKDLELSLLRTFLAVAHDESLGKTAVAAAMTQPAISQQMLRLEKIVGQTLFACNRNGVTLTHHGESLISYANRAVDLNEEALLRLRGDGAGRRICLGISEGVALAGLAEVLKHFRNSNPDVAMAVTVAEPDRLNNMMREGALDLVIGETEFLIGRPVMAWRADLPWATNQDRLVDRCQPIRLILFESSSSCREEMLESSSRGKWNWRVVFKSSRIDAIFAAVESGLGISVLAVKAIRNSEVRRLEHVELPSPPPVRFGLFRVSAAPNEAQAAMDAALASTFEIKDREVKAVRKLRASFRRLKQSKSQSVRRESLKHRQA